jgi:hypothetical protein
VLFLSEASIERCLRFFRAIDECGGAAGKWDLIKVAGNEAAFKRWVEDFLIYHSFVEETDEGSKTRYQKTKKGEMFHSLLSDYGFVMAFKRVSGRKLRGPS